MFQGRLATSPLQTGNEDSRIACPGVRQGDIASLKNENYHQNLLCKWEEELEKNRKSPCPFLNYFFNGLTTAFDITYHMQLVRHTDFGFYCCGTEIRPEMSTNTLGIDACHFTLIHLLFFSIVTYTKHPLYFRHCARYYFEY